MKYLSLLLIVFVGAPAFAQYESYDEIVEKLSKYTDTTPIKRSSKPSFETRDFAMVHAGLGITQTFYDADAAGLNSSMQNQGGLLINIGADVLSRKWAIEGSFANYGRTETSNSNIKLREYTLKGLYKPSITKNWSMRLGLGFSSRFLDVQNAVTNQSYKTPSGLFLMGIDTYISRMISVGADLNFKTSMIDDTIDKNSVDLSFRVDTHF